MTAQEWLHYLHEENDAARPWLFSHRKRLLDVVEAALKLDECNEDYGHVLSNHEMSWQFRNLHKCLHGHDSEFS